MRTISSLMNLKGRTALITGGAGHIGSAIASALSECGANIAIVDVNNAKLPGAQNIVADLCDTNRLQGIPEEVEKKFGSLDIIVHAAALVGTSALEGWSVPVNAQSVETWRKALEVNLTSFFTLTQAAIPALKKSGHGSVITVGSIYGMLGPDWSLYKDTAMANPAAYAASKGGLMQMTRWFATTLAPHIRVNGIIPGGVFRDTKEPFLSRYVSRTPMGRMASEEDFTGAALYLASDMSAYMTGQHLVVDGGWSAW